ncbi:MAG: hypothetical protein K8I00_11600, partial [Candidatus Omnitrophica bacterium]|nr:hypothetical protein [Candidatus Omnitrophota bacterium]
MPLMTIFYIVAGICLVGILIALWLMQKEAEQVHSVGIQKLAPEEIKAYDPQTETVNVGTRTKQAPVKKEAKPKKSRVPLKGLFGRDTAGDISVR